MKKIYCNFNIKDNLIADFVATWKEGESAFSYGDRSVLGYVLFAVIFPFVVLLAVIGLIFQFLFSFKVRR